MTACCHFVWWTCANVQAFQTCTSLIQLEVAQQTAWCEQQRHQSHSVPSHSPYMLKSFLMPGCGWYQSLSKGTKRLPLASEVGQAALLCIVKLAG